MDNFIFWLEGFIDKPGPISDEDKKVIKNRIQKIKNLQYPIDNKLPSYPHKIYNSWGNPNDYYFCNDEFAKKYFK